MLNILFYDTVIIKTNNETKKFISIQKFSIKTFLFKYLYFFQILHFFPIFEDNFIVLLWGILMKYFIGLDGGGTKTKCVLTDENLKVLNEFSGENSAFLLRGTDQVAESIYDLIMRSVYQAELDISDISGIVLGSTGAGRRDDAESMENAFQEFTKTKNLELKNFRVVSDARIALEGSFSGQSGSILIAGTGSIMFGKDKADNIHRVGGFGRFIGDEGSGYMLGRLGLMAVAKDLDKRGLPSMLTNMVKKEFNIDSSAKLITEVYKNNFDIAKVSPFVVAAAEKHDEVCSEIITHQLNELLLHLRAMHSILQEPKLNLSLIGGTITSKNYYADEFRKMIKDKLPEVNLKEPDYPPQIGAVIMAKKLFNN